MKSIGLIGLLCLGFWLSSCESGNIEMDNAGSENLVVTIDGGVQIPVEAGGFKRIELKKNSPHKIIIQNQENQVLREETFRVEEGGLLNLSGTQYVIWTELYGSSERRKQDLQEDFYEVAGDKLYGDFQFVPRKEDKDPSVYYESQWDFGLDQRFPEDLLGWKITNKTAIPKRKIYRAEILREEYLQLLKSQ